MTLLERFDKMVKEAWVIGHKEDIDEIRRRLAIAQAVDETYPDMRDSLLRRADELLGGGK